MRKKSIFILLGLFGLLLNGTTMLAQQPTPVLQVPKLPRPVPTPQPVPQKPVPTSRPIATPIPGASLAQPQATPIPLPKASPSSKSPEAEELSRKFDEAALLMVQNTAESMKSTRDKCKYLLENFRDVGDKNTRNSVDAGCYFFIGRTSESLGDFKMALEYYDKALFYFIDNPLFLASTFEGMGRIYSSLGDYVKAAGFFKRAFDKNVENQNRSGVVSSLYFLAGAFNNLGYKAKALEVYNVALKLNEKEDNPKMQAFLLNALGGIYKESGEFDKALENYNKALELYYKVEYFGIKGYYTGTAGTLNSVGVVYASLRNDEKSVESFKDALLLAFATGDKGIETDSLNNLADLQFTQSAKNGEKDYGKLRLATFYLKRAVNNYQEFRSAARGLDVNLQKNFSKSIGGSYRKLIALLIVQRRFAEAYQVLNDFKDQQFFDFNFTKQETMFNVAIFDSSTQKAFPQLAFNSQEQAFAGHYEQALQNYKTVRLQLDDVKNKSGGGKPENSSSLQQSEVKVKGAKDGFTKLLEQAATEFKEQPPEINKDNGLSQAQATLSELSQQTKQKTVAVFVIVADFGLTEFIISPDSVDFVYSSLDAKALNDKAFQLWALLQSDTYDPRKVSEELYTDVFKPLEAKLPKDTQTIIWSLDGNLRYVPMAALYDGKQYLVERYNNVLLTRMNKENLVRPVSAKWTGLGLGSSQASTVDLSGDKISFNAIPGVKEELASLFHTGVKKTGIFTGEVLSDAKFTKLAMLDALKKKHPLVHIASHFSFSPGYDANSFLLLGDNTAFTLAEMKQQGKLFDGVELLTLSACNTAAERSNEYGQEIDGFAELAQRLGAGAVMATLWAVADKSTPDLMLRFYDLKLNQKLTKAEALRRAQLALLRGESDAKPTLTRTNLSPIKIVIAKTPEDKKRQPENTRSKVIYLDEQDAPEFVADKTKPFAHPFYWSPFILFGNWR